MSVRNVNKLKMLCPHNDIQLFHETHVNLQAVIHWFTLTEKFYGNKNRNLSHYVVRNALLSVRGISRIVARPWR
jgi:hypothetical protein